MMLLRPYRPSTAHPASAFIVLHDGHSGSNAEGASPQGSVAVALRVPEQPGRPAEGRGTIWESVMRDWCVFTRTPLMADQMQSAKESVKQVLKKRIDFL